LRQMVLRKNFFKLLSNQNVT